MKVKIDNKIKMKIIKVYAPTAGAEEAEIEKFYQDLGSTITEEKEYYNIIMGDFNAKVGRREDINSATGKYGIGEGNRRGGRNDRIC